VTHYADGSLAAHPPSVRAGTAAPVIDVPSRRRLPVACLLVSSRPAARPVVHVEPLGIDLEARPGETIIEAAWRLGYHWPTVCYGQASCLTCHVEVLDGAEHLTPVDDQERVAIEQGMPRRRTDLSRIRLACQARVHGAVTVRKPGVRVQAHSAEAG
jgi:2Fe-2S ferredoxin